MAKRLIVKHEKASCNNYCFDYNDNNMKPLHVAKGENHVIIFPPQFEPQLYSYTLIIYLITLSEFKQIKFLLTSLTDMHAGLIAIFIFLATGFESL